LRKVDSEIIKNTVKNLILEANYNIDYDIIKRIKELSTQEESPIGQEILGILLKNYQLAKEEKMPICQDTGVVIIFLEIGQEVIIQGENLYNTINKAIRQAYTENYLRASMVYDPVFDRKNTKDNTPGIIYTDIVPGDKIKISVLIKGGGAENMSEVRMLTPSDGIEEIKKFVLERVENSGANPCPPVVVGIGIGGSFEQCAILAKKSLLRPIYDKNPDKRYAQLEEQLLKEINKLGIGPQGLGGRITALAVKIEVRPCHIASLPVAVNINCHAHRHKTAII